jgi:hypothetical protein
VTPAGNDGTTVHKLTVKEYPPKASGHNCLQRPSYLQPNRDNSYSVNYITAKKRADGSVVVQFGGCNGEIPNCLPIMKGWNYTGRLYLARTKVPDSTWKFPEAQPVS